MTDGQAMNIARRLNRMNWKMHKLCLKLADEHPNGKDILEALRTNGYDNPADADDVIVDHLINPENWSKKDYEWRRK